MTEQGGQDDQEYILTSEGVVKHIELVDDALRLTCQLLEHRLGKGTTRFGTTPEAFATLQDTYGSARRVWRFQPV